MSSELLSKSRAEARRAYERFHHPEKFDRSAQKSSINGDQGQEERSDDDVFSIHSNADSQPSETDLPRVPSPPSLQSSPSPSSPPPPTIHYSGFGSPGFNRSPHTAAFYEASSFGPIASDLNGYGSSPRESPGYHGNGRGAFDATSPYGPVANSLADFGSASTYGISMAAPFTTFTNRDRSGAIPMTGRYGFQSHEAATPMSTSEQVTSVRSPHRSRTRRHDRRGNRHRDHNPPTHSNGTHRSHQKHSKSHGKRTSKGEIFTSRGVKLNRDGHEIFDVDDSDESRNRKGKKADSVDKGKKARELLCKLFL